MSKNKKHVAIFHLKIFVFTALENCSILHGHVFVMCTCCPCLMHNLEFSFYYLKSVQKHLKKLTVCYIIQNLDENLFRLMLKSLQRSV